MQSVTYPNLSVDHIYQLDNLLLEAGYCNGWILSVVTTDGEYIPVQNGVLTALQLHENKQWKMIKHFADPRHGGQWNYIYGDTMEIEPEQFIFVACGRNALKENMSEQDTYSDQQFYELMAVMNWDSIAI